MEVYSYYGGKFTIGKMRLNKLYTTEMSMWLSAPQKSAGEQFLIRVKNNH